MNHARMILAMTLAYAPGVTGCGGSFPDDPQACVGVRTAHSAVRELGAVSLPEVDELTIEAQVEPGDWVMVAVAGTVDPMVGNVPEVSVAGLDAPWQPLAVSWRPSMPGSMEAPRKLWVFAAVAPRAAGGPLTVSFDGPVNLAQANVVAVAGVEDPDALLAEGSPDVVTAHALDFETMASIPMGSVEPDALVMAVVFAGENNPVGPGHTFDVEPIDMEMVSHTYGLEAGKERVTTTAWAVGRSDHEAQFIDHTAGAHWLGEGIELQLGEAPVPGGDSGADGDDGSMPGDSGGEDEGGQGSGGDEAGEPGADAASDDAMHDSGDEATTGTDCSFD